MADGKTHKAIGTLGGTVASLIFNDQKGTPNLSLIYLAGGAIGGRIGGRLPDIIDIPDSPFHRSFGHSVSINGIAYLNKRAKKIFHDCLDCLIQKANKFMNEGNKILYCLCHFAAAFLIGFATGHGLHLVTDMFYPMGLPLLF
ncbi:MAG: hypothetical protein JW715_00350 [Sedimentisphaerales bacterium]|nr:hypothetical protein [Sedimentisphaerales bacterium]